MPRVEPIQLIALLHQAGIDLKDAEQMPMHYALAFLSEKSDLLQQAKNLNLSVSGHKILMQPPHQIQKTYVSTKRVCK